MPLTEEPRRAIEVFYSYAHEDERLRKHLENQLALLRRQGLITDWHDHEICPGTELENEVNKHLNSAQIILLLISPDFMASEYCYSIELRRAIERHDTGVVHVIPVILRPTDWKSGPFGKLKALPLDGKPVTRWPNRDEAFLNIAEGIRIVLERLTPYSGIAYVSQSEYQDRKAVLRPDSSSLNVSNTETLQQTYLKYLQEISLIKEEIHHVRQETYLITQQIHHLQQEWQNDLTALKETNTFSNNLRWAIPSPEEIFMLLNNLMTQQLTMDKNQKAEDLLPIKPEIVEVLVGEETLEQIHHILEEKQPSLLSNLTLDTLRTVIIQLRKNGQ